MAEQESTPKIHVDSDWKAEAQAEKTRLAEQEQQKEQQPRPDAGARGLPAADFKTLMGMLASQAIMGLGAMADQQTGRVVIDLEGSKLSIDLLGILEEKTEGNLSEEEASELNQVLTELRSRFVQVTQLVADAAKEGNVTAAGDPAAVAPVVQPPPGDLLGQQP